MRYLNNPTVLSLTLTKKRRQLSASRNKRNCTEHQTPCNVELISCVQSSQSVNFSVQPNPSKLFDFKTWSTLWSFSQTQIILLTWLTLLISATFNYFQNQERTVIYPFQLILQETGHMTMYISWIMRLSNKLEYFKMLNSKHILRLHVLFDNLNKTQPDLRLNKLYRAVKKTGFS